jgi:hypothetical protein
MEEKDKFEVIGNPENSVPKYATNANFRQLANGDIVISFVSKSSDQDQGVLIETVIIDEPHAREIAEILTSMLKTKNDN